MIPITKPEWKQELEFLTPCFCAGGDQGDAELRVPSLRGELRWWLRCLGATRAQEWALFGGPAKGDKKGGMASSISVRAKLLRATKDAWNKDNLNNVDYFIKERGSFLSVGTTFEVQMWQVHPIGDPEALRLLDLAWRCLCSLGAIGSRKTRGYGAIAPCNPQSENVEGLLKEITPIFSSRTYTLQQKDRREGIIKRIGELVRDKRKSGYNHKTPTIMGYAKIGKGLPPEFPDRQMSEVRYRPIRKPDGTLALLALQAPESTLDPVAAKYSRGFRL